MTEPLTDAQKRMMDANRKEYDIKFKTWAIDRAIEMFKISGNSGEASAKFIIAEAEKLCAWITGSPKEFAVPTADEAAAWAEEQAV